MLQYKEVMVIFESLQTGDLNATVTMLAHNRAHSHRFLAEREFLRDTDIVGQG